MLQAIHEPYSQYFLERSVHGVLAAVRLPDREDADARLALLTPEERDHVTTLAPLHRVAWIGGRTALRLAARHLGLSLNTVLSTPRGAPELPPSIIGSVSHKPCVAIAIIDRAGCDEAIVETVGVDIEDLDRPRPKIARLVLRDDELARVNTLPEDLRWRAIATAFSMKESIFKAIDPHVQRYVGFHEAEIEVLDHHRAKVVLHLREKEGPFAIDAWWDVRGSHVITSIRAQATCGASSRTLPSEPSSAPPRVRWSCGRAAP